MVLGAVEIALRQFEATEQGAGRGEARIAGQQLLQQVAGRIDLPFLPLLPRGVDLGGWVGWLGLLTADQQQNEQNQAEAASETSRYRMRQCWRRVDNGRLREDQWGLADVVGERF